MDQSSQPARFEMPAGSPQGETPAAMPEQAPQQGPVLPPVQQSAPLPQTDPASLAVPASGQVPAAAPTTTPAVADDLDLIEKEWVEKAKAIVAQTRNDPHAQNAQMNRFKADYMKKRYNKDIKVPEGS